MTKQVWISVFDSGYDELWLTRSSKSEEDAMRQAEEYKGFHWGVQIHGTIRAWVDEDGKLNAEVVKETTE